MHEILQALRNCWEKKERAVVATIVDVEGSAYRREGTRCLCLENGRVIGILSGGCVEEDLAERARSVLESGRPQEVRYDFRSQDDTVWGFNTGCNGILTIWLQTFDPIMEPGAALQLVCELEKRVTCQTGYTIATVVSSADEHRLPVGKQWILDSRAASEFQSQGIAAKRVTQTIDGIQAQVLIEAVEPCPRLIIFGAGMGAVSLAQGGKKLHWNVSVVDHREKYANRVNYPEVDRIELITRDEYETFPVSDGTYIVVMTHNFELDRMLIQRFLPRTIPYLGVMGSRDRIRKLLASIPLIGELPEDHLKKLHSPIGLDIGAKTPEEIALSILSELVCRKNGGKGKSLRESDDDLTDGVRRIQADPFISY